MSNINHEKFISQMESAGYKTQDYRGRNFYHGPAVIVKIEELQEVLGATTVKVQWDQMGKNGLVIYPK